MLFINFMVALNTLEYVVEINKFGRIQCRLCNYSIGLSAGIA